jgi:peptidoglycan LD-endopeptidase CwlK
MPKFSQKSRDNLARLHPQLQRLLCEAIKEVDFSIVEGYRPLDRQKELYEQGKSKILEGKHNKYPSDAVDIAPYPYPKNELELRQLYYLMGIIKGISIRMGIKIRFGGDWNRNNDIRDDKFQDAWHLELA